jgi:hypothetical protein
MISKKILSIIVGIVIVGAGAGTYFVLSNQGYVNPGIQITSVTSTSNDMMNGSSDMPGFTAHVDSSKTAEYEVITNGSIIFSGTVTGNQTIQFPSTFTQAIELCDILSVPGLHTLTFKVVYNSYSTSKTVHLYTFPPVSFSCQHSYIDTGVSDTITASTSADNMTLSAPGISHTGSSMTITPSSPGNVTINYSLSHGSYHFSGQAAQVQVYSPPTAISISASNVTNDSCTFAPYTCFDINMLSAGGDTHNTGLTYYLYINDTCYVNMSLSSHSESYPISENGSGPFTAYFIVKDNYYSSTSNTITINS